MPKLTCIFVFLAAVLLDSSISWAAPVPVNFVTAHVDSEKAINAVWPFWVSLGLGLGADPLLMRGAFISVGWQYHWIGLDARVGFGTTSYSMIGVAAGPTDFDTSTEAGDPLAERARPRNGSDSWSYFLVEPGISVSGRLFASSLPLFSQRARFGVGYGSMNDQTHALGFSAITYSFEGDAEYQLGVGSRFGLRGGIIYNAGVLENKAQPDPTAGRLPASWLQEQLSLVYYL